MKQRMFSAIVRHRRVILVIYALLIALAVWCVPQVGVEYDMNQYLPADTPSTVAIDVMGSEFGGGIPNARAMAPIDSIARGLALKQEISQVPGVESVMWLDDVIDLKVPLQTQDPASVQTYYKDGYALYSVTIATDSRISAVEAIHDIVGEDGAMEGNAVDVAVATVSTVDQIRIISVFAVLFVIFIIAITTTSWLDPITVLAGIGIAVLLNMGSNLIFGTISFVTNAAGSILQLAVSLDYSIFLLHRFEQCRAARGCAPGDRAVLELAMVDALCGSATSITASSATTVAGFLSLAVMQFRIGPDLGLALAKGVAIGLVCVFTLTPAMLLSLDGLASLLRHRKIVPAFRRLGPAVMALSIPVALLFVACSVPAFKASTSPQINYWYGASHIFGPQTESGQEAQAIIDVFGQSDTYVLLVPRGNLSQQRALSASLKTLPQVTGVISYVDRVGAGLPRELVGQDALVLLESPSYSRMVISVAAAEEGDETFELVGAIRAIAQSYYPDAYHLAGKGVSTADLRITITQDKQVVDLLSVAAVLVLLLLATRSLTLPVLMVLVIETAIWINFALPYFTDASLFYLSYLICSTIQLGATVDYANLFADRYMEARRTTELAPRACAEKVINENTVSILISGTAIVVTASLMATISTHGIVSQMGYYLAVGALISLVGTMFVLPRLLVLLDGLIMHTTMHPRDFGIREM